VRKTFGALCVLAAIALASSGVACGGRDAAESDSSFATAVRSDAVLGSLSAGDRSRLCEDVEAHLSALRSSLRETACKASGLLEAEVAAGENGAASDAELQAACSAAYEACVTGDGGRSPLACDFSGVTASDCTATVTDFAACVDGFDVQLRALYAGLTSCGAVTRRTLSSALSFDCGIIPPSCAALASGCPSLWNLATAH
jgi:hypothetical protein